MALPGVWLVASPLDPGAGLSLIFVPLLWGVGLQYTVCFQIGSFDVVALP